MIGRCQRGQQGSQRIGGLWSGGEGQHSESVGRGRGLRVGRWLRQLTATAVCALGCALCVPSRTTAKR